MSVGTDSGADRSLDSRRRSTANMCRNEERRFLEVDESEASELEEFIESRLGRVLGATGRGGSGVFIRHPEGPVVLLTAAHVVFGAALTGEITVLAASQVPARSVCPADIFIDERRDLAVLVWPSDAQQPDCYPVEAWDQQVGEVHGMEVITAGFPGEFQDQPDAGNRSIAIGRFLHIWSRTQRPLSGVLVRIDIDETDSRLPGSFRGMSGGPVLARDGALLGVNTMEWQQPAGRRGILYTPLEARSSLIAPFPGRDGQAWTKRVLAVQFRAVFPQPDGQATTGVRFEVEEWREPQVQACIGRVTEIVVEGLAGPRLRLESVFDMDYTDDDSEFQYWAMQECRQILTEVFGAEVVPAGSS